MGDVTEIPLPGVGVRHEFTTGSGERVGVISHRSGRRELVVYDRGDPDACRTVMNLDAEDTRTLSELLGASRVNEALLAVQQQVEGLVIEWIRVGPPPGLGGSTIGEGKIRTTTGAYVVAVIRDEETIPAPGPDLRFEDGDVAVAIGTSDALGELNLLLTGG